MGAIANTLLHFFVHLGAAGLFLLGVLDSSFLMLPVGNDLLLVSLTAHAKDHLLYYIPIAALGSTAGVLLMDLVARQRGEDGLRKRMSPRRLEFLKCKIADRAGLAVAVASLAPPPFPFTPVIAAASAFAYPRWKLLTTIFVTRLIRFTIIGLLAVKYGSNILAFAQKPSFEYFMIGFIVLCLAGSGYSIYSWVRR